jgi:hypothetical protein
VTATVGVTSLLAVTFGVTSILVELLGTLTTGIELLPTLIALLGKVRESGIGAVATGLLEAGSIARTWPVTADGSVL